MFHLSYLDNRVPITAQRIHAVRMAAYEQEAKLLGLDRFPPLDERVNDILNSSEEFVGAFQGTTLAGVLSNSADEEGRGMTINSLVVHPAFQRLGLGRSLVKGMIGRHCSLEITVQTAAANVPALELYASLGFAEYRRWSVGSPPLELVKLRRSPAQVPSPA
jgi:ribosomal protein S18 acetylase RimI-like enzyme